MPGPAHRAPTRRSPRRKPHPAEPAVGTRRGLVDADATKESAQRAQYLVLAEAVGHPARPSIDEQPLQDEARIRMPGHAVVRVRETVGSTRLLRRLPHQRRDEAVCAAARRAGTWRTSFPTLEEARRATRVLRLTPWGRPSVGTSASSQRARPIRAAETAQRTAPAAGASAPPTTRQERRSTAPARPAEDECCTSSATTRSERPSPAATRSEPPSPAARSERPSPAAATASWTATHRQAVGTARTTATTIHAAGSAGRTAPH